MFLLDNMYKVINSKNEHNIKFNISHFWIFYRFCLGKSYHPDHEMLQKETDK